MILHFSTFVAATETSETSEGIGALGIDPIAMLLQAGTFLLIFWIVRKYFLENIVNALEARREKIAESLKNADQIETVRANLEKEQKLIIKKAHDQSAEIIARAHEDAGVLLAEAEAKAQKRADTIIQNAEQQAEADVEKARRELKKELLGVVVEATETILEQKLDDQKDKSLIKRALERESL